MGESLGISVRTTDISRNLKERIGGSVANVWVALLAGEGGREVVSKNRDPVQKRPVPDLLRDCPLVNEQRIVLDISRETIGEINTDSID